MCADECLFRSLPPNSPERERVMQRLLSCKRIITFGTMFQDFLYLRACFEGLQSLLPTNWRKHHRTLREAFRHMFRPEGPHANTFEHKYLDLWLFALREWCHLADKKSCAPRKDGSTGPVSVCRQPEKRLELLQLGHQAGFDVNFDKFVPAAMSRQAHPSQGLPLLSSDEPIASRARSNRPLQSGWAQIQGYLYAENIGDLTYTLKQWPSPFAVVRDLVQCCWVPECDRRVTGDVGQEATFRRTRMRGSMLRPLHLQSGNSKSMSAGLGLPQNPQVKEAMDIDGLPQSDGQIPSSPLAETSRVAQEEVKAWVHKAKRPKAPDSSSHFNMNQYSDDGAVTRDPSSCYSNVEPRSDCGDAELGTPGTRYSSCVALSSHLQSSDIGEDRGPPIRLQKSEIEQDELYRTLFSQLGEYHHTPKVRLTLMVAFSRRWFM